VTITDEGDTVVSLEGELDHEGVQMIEDVVARAAAAAQGRLVLDAEAVTFVDSAGLRLILQTQMSVTSRQVGFTLEHPSGNVVRLLELTGLDDLIGTS